MGRKEERSGGDEIRDWAVDWTRKKKKEKKREKGGSTIKQGGKKKFFKSYHGSG